MNIWETIVSVLNKYKRILVEIVTTIVLCSICVFAISKCTYYKDTNQNNIIALTDTVKYYQGKLGNEVASKTMIEANYSSLQNINDSLYRLVESMKIKNPTTVIGGKVVVENVTHDTIWVPTKTEIDTKNIAYNFNFSNKYRELEGTVKYMNDTLSLDFDKDKTMFDYVLAIKDGSVYMTSDNPYVKFSNITGLKVPESTKKKRFGIGPGVFVGYGKGGFTYGLGLSIQYNLIQF